MKRLIAVLLFSTACIACLMAQVVFVGFNPGSVGPSLIQQTNCAWASGTTYTCTLGSSPIAGHILIFGGGAAISSTTPTVTPSSSGASWTQLSTAHSGGGPVADSDIWCATLTGSPGTTITITTQSTITASDATISEWATTHGTCTQDSGSPQTHTASNTGPNTTALTTTNASDVLYANYFVAASDVFISGPTGGYTALTVSGSAFNQQAYQIVSSTGTYTASWSITSSHSWAALSVAIQN